MTIEAVVLTAALVGALGRVSWIPVQAALARRHDRLTLACAVRRVAAINQAMTAKLA